MPATGQRARVAAGQGALDAGVRDARLPGVRSGADDVALTTRATRWPEESTVVLARSGQRPTTVELEALLDEALWTPSCDDTVAVREEQERFEDRTHEVATNLLLPARRGRRRTAAPAVAAG